MEVALSVFGALMLLLMTGLLFFPRLYPFARLQIDQHKKCNEAVANLQRQIDELKRELEELKQK